MGSLRERADGMPAVPAEGVNDMICTTATGFAVALATGAVAATTLFHADWIYDPVEVVGAPLLEGYSERSEMLAWLCFYLTSLAVPVLTLWVCRFLPPRILRLTGLIALAVVPLELMVFDLLGSEMIMVALAVATAGLVGTRLSSASMETTSVARIEQWVWTGLFLLLCFRDFGYLLSALKSPALLAFLVVLVPSLRWLWRRQPRLAELFHLLRRMFQSCQESGAVFLGMGIASLLMLSAAELALIPAMLFAGQITRPWHRSEPKAAGRSHSGQLILLSLGLSVAVVLANWCFSYQATLSSLLVMPLLAMACVTTHRLQGEQSLRWTEQMMTSSTVHRRLQPAVVVLTIVALTWVSWWSALAAGMLMALMTVFRRYHRPGRAAALLTATILLLAFIPNLNVTPRVDAFHDGQILSAISDVDAGGALYTDVFPLRSQEFFTAWAGRQVLPATFSGFKTVQSLPAFLQASAGFLICFVWTRSLIWGLSAGMLFLTQPLAPRQAMLLILAAMVLEILRSDRRRFWLLLAIPGVLSCFYGFDGIGPIGLAAVGSVVLSRLQQFAASPGSRVSALVRMGGDALLVSVALLLPFSLLISVLYGPESAASYWFLFVDNARHLNAFYGLPMRLFDLVNHPAAARAIVLLAFWNTCLVAGSSGMLTPRRREWLFVSLFAFFWSLRAVGRSDAGHFDCLYNVAVLLAVLLLFESMGIARKIVKRAALTDRRTVALGLGLLAAWQIPHHSSHPIRAWQQISRLPMDETVDLGVNEFVLDTVDESEWFWPVENGMATYAHRRRNPTRHAIAYTISSSQEQRNTVMRLREKPPRLIEWPSVDQSIAVPLRYYVITQHVYQHYRPAAVEGYLEPVSQRNRGQKVVPRTLQKCLGMRQLPWSWGRRRLPYHDAALRRSLPVSLSPPSEPSSPDELRCWDLKLPYSAGEYNYLLLRARCTADGPQAPVWTDLAIGQFAAGCPATDPIATFSVLADGEEYPYLIPIGCSASWSWQESGTNWALSAKTQEVQLTECRLLSIDEMGETTGVP